MEGIQDYSSDSSDEEEQAIDINTTNNKRSLPPLPQDLADKFTKRPKLPHPEFYDNPNYKNNKTTTMAPVGRLLRQFTYIDIRPSRQLSDQISDLNEILKMYLRMNGYGELLTRFERLHLSELSAPQALHISLTGETLFTKEGCKLYNDELSKKLKTIEMDNEDSNSITFDKIKAYPNFDSTGLFLAMSVSQKSSKTISKILRAVQELESKYVVKDSSQYPISPENLHCSIARVLTPVDYLKDPKTLQKINEVFKDLEVPESLEFKYSTLKVLEDSRSSLSFPIEAFTTKTSPSSSTST